jgi:hypothetical protein
VEVHAAKIWYGIAFLVGGMGMLVAISQVWAGQGGGWILVGAGFVVFAYAPINSVAVEVVNEPDAFVIRYMFGKDVRVPKAGLHDGEQAWIRLRSAGVEGHHFGGPKAENRKEVIAFLSCHLRH